MHLFESLELFRGCCDMTRARRLRWLLYSVRVLRRPAAGSPLYLTAHNSHRSHLARVMSQQPLGRGQLGSVGSF
jgi:hypothetical protein